MKNQKLFGARIRAERRAREITQSAVGAAIGRSATYVCCIERGYIVATPDEEKRLARFLQIPLRPRNGGAQ